MNLPSHQECRHWKLTVPMYEIGACGAVDDGSLAAAEHVPGAPGCVFGDSDATGCRQFKRREEVPHMTDFELAADAIKPPTIRETAVAAVGLAAWTGAYCGARLIGGTIALSVWGVKAALSAWRTRR